MSLTEVSYYFRKTAPFAILSVIVLFILYYSVQLTILFIELSRPRDQQIAELIDPVFGKIPAPSFRESTPSGSFEYTLDTIDGVPVTATPASQVYFLPRSPGRFGFRENVYLMAKNLGINTELVRYRLNGNEAVFSDSKQKLTVDITNYNFDYEYNLLKNDNDRLSDAIIPSEKEITTTATELLSKLGRYPGELARGKINIIYLAFNPETEELTVVKSPENANLVEVDFYRPDMGQFPVVSPRYFNSQNYVVMLFDTRGYKVVKAKVRFYEKSNEQVGIYPIKTGDQAWQDFIDGKGYVVSANEGTQFVSIKKMFMGYLDPDTYQEFLQPVYVFLGDNNFAGYVPAITDEYLFEATPEAKPTLDMSSTEITNPDASGLDTAPIDDVSGSVGTEGAEGLDTGDNGLESDPETSFPADASGSAEGLALPTGEPTIAAPSGVLYVSPSPTRLRSSTPTPTRAQQLPGSL